MFPASLPTHRGQFIFELPNTAYLSDLYGRSADAPQSFRGPFKEILTGGDPVKVTYAVGAKA